MELRLAIEGISDDQMRRGIAAAEEVFNGTGITPLQAAEGRFALELWNELGFPDDEEVYSDADAQAADIWFEADRAAVAACFPGEPEKVSLTPESLELHGIEYEEDGDGGQEEEEKELCVDLKELKPVQA